MTKIDNSLVINLPKLIYSASGSLDGYSRVHEWWKCQSTPKKERSYSQTIMFQGFFLSMKVRFIYQSDSCDMI